MGGFAAIVIGEKGGAIGLGAAAGPVGIAIAVCTILYFTSRSAYWYNNERSVTSVERMS